MPFQYFSKHPGSTQGALGTSQGPPRTPHGPQRFPGAPPGPPRISRGISQGQVQAGCGNLELLVWGDCGNLELLDCPFELSGTSPSISRASQGRSRLAKFRTFVEIWNFWIAHLSFPARPSTSRGPPGLLGWPGLGQLWKFGTSGLPI